MDTVVELLESYFKFEFLRTLSQKYLSIDFESLVVITLVLCVILYVLVTFLRSIPPQSVALGEVNRVAENRLQSSLSAKKY